MHLQDHAAAEVLLAETAPDADHGDLNNVCGCTLYRGIDGAPLGVTADDGVARPDVGQEEAAAEERLHVTLLRGRLDRCVHVSLDAWVGGEVAVDQLAGFGAGDGEALGQAKGGDAVDDAKVGRLGAAAHVGGDLLGGDAEDLGGRGGVDVGTVAEGVGHVFVAAEMGHDAQLDLRIVGRKEDGFGVVSGEGFADLAAQLLAHGDVLQVGV